MRPYQAITPLAVVQPRSFGLCKAQVQCTNEWVVNALLVLNQQSAQQAQGKERIYINKNKNWLMTHRVLNNTVS